MEPVTFVHLVGIGNSGPGPWQHYRHTADRRTVRVEHDSWDHPDRDARVADLVEAGDLGHINAASHLGTWPEGRRPLTRLLPPAA
ncbi:serine hydrolase [Kitasatospora sp. SolWspMP-SS2h]|uniref:alpha/beta hydrolase n=1 Tax=Kitasatospora sp. SolWspMP-SS2h TaxID=1305729 RepID=UPI000DB9CF23|nr:alpha/beta hydrolase [Kitasatospora sp. SolWspMP-SS2h]RAJ31210.1 serine hydrolase [Kitasatospora sp. SolWspMP-SS2h]